MSFFSRFKPLAAPFIRRVVLQILPEAEVLQEEEIQLVRAPSVLPGMLERVSDTPPPGTLSEHIREATATKLTHAPVLRWRYRNVLVFPSGYSTWSRSDYYGKFRNFKELCKPITHVPKLRYCRNSLAGRYFGHWLSDSVPSTLIDLHEGPPWMHFQPEWPHAKEYLDVLDITALDAPLVHAEELIVYQDFAQGSHKQNRYNILRNKLRMAFGNPDATDCVFLKRGAKGIRRAISNEAELMDRLIARNWKILSVDEMNMSELQQGICRAKVVVGMEGSHLNHAQFGLGSGTSLVILIPGDRFTTNHFGRAAAKQISTGFVVLEGDQFNGYHVDLDELLLTVDMTLNV